MKIEDLDVLRPEPRQLRIGGKDIDVSFIPCGITFDVDAIVAELRDLDQDAVASGGDEARKAFNISIRLCATFCKFKYPELDERWFMENATPAQVQRFTEAVKDALVNAYAGIEASGPQKAAKARTKE